MRDYFTGMLMGGILGAAATVFYLNDERRIKLGIKKRVRQVIAKTARVSQFGNDTEAELGHIIRK